MEITLALPDDIATQLQNLPNPNEFVSGLLKKAFKNPTVPVGMEINTMEMVRKIRDQHYELLKDKTHEEQMAFYRESTHWFHNYAIEKGLRIKGLTD
jgi:hypothetical protein